MNDKGTRRKAPGPKTGYYAVLYSLIGVMLIAAVVLGYVTFKGGAAGKGEPPQFVEEPGAAQAPNEANVVAPDNDSRAVSVQEDPTVADVTAQTNDGNLIITKATAPPPPPPTETPKPTPAAAAPPQSPPSPTPSETGAGAEPAGASAEADAAPGEFTAYDPELKMKWPLVGEIVMPFSVDTLVYDKTLEHYRTNDSVSINAEAGSEVHAAWGGTVTDITNTIENGNTLTIDHGNGWGTTYSQLADDIAVGLGDVVDAGQIVGYVGEPSIYSVRLGTHLTFEVTLNEQPINPGNILE